MQGSGKDSPVKFLHCCDAASLNAHSTCLINIISGRNCMVLMIMVIGGAGKLTDIHTIGN
jgi:hypothetical protein